MPGSCRDLSGEGASPRLDIVRAASDQGRVVPHEGRIKSTKTAETRAVDLSPSLGQQLEGYLAWLNAEKRSPAGRSVGSSQVRSGDSWRSDASREVFYSVLKAPELPSFRLYDLRHTVASLPVSSGTPLLYVSRQLGHANPTTLKYYAK
jgi:integrase